MDKLALLIEDIKNSRNTEKLNNLLEKIEGKTKLEEKYLEFVKNDQELAYFTLMNKNKNSKFLLEIKHIFKESELYKKLERHFYHPDLSVRMYFLNEISKVRSDIFVDIYMELMSYKEWELRVKIAESLAKYTDNNSMILLVSMLEDYDRRVIKEVILRLSNKGDAILPYLDKYIKLPMTRLKVNILDLLNKIKTVKTLRYLAMLAMDSSEEVKIKAQHTIMLIVEKFDVEEEDEEIENILEFLEEEISKTNAKSMAPLVKLLLKFREKGAKVLVEDIENKWADKSEYLQVIKEVKKFEKIYLIFEMLVSKVVEIKERGFELLQKLEIREENQAEVIRIMANYIENREDEIFEKERDIVINFIIKSNLLEKVALMLKSEDSDQRVRAVEIIGIIGDHKLMQFLSAVGKDPDKRVRKAVIRVLAREERPENLFYFKEMLEDPESDVQEEAIEAITKVEGDDARRIIFETMNHPNKKIKDKVGKIIAKESLRKYVDDFEKLTEEVKVKIGKMIDDLKEESEKILYKEMKSIDPKIRERVLNILEYVPTKAYFKSILKFAIKDPDKRIRARVVGLLIKTKEREMLIALLKMANDPDRRVRANVIEAFGDSNNKASIKVLKQFLKDPDNRIRANAIIALHRLKDYDGHREIESMLLDESELMRASAVYAVGELRLENKVGSLQRVVGDESSLVRKNVVKTFGKLDQKKELVRFLSDRDNEVRVLAKKVYEQGGM